ncbi:hypothetical protein DERP_007632 [Dermatophagoides pteronyssinus]|uniref:Uncharacterized protein n=1 Tax=Dermatophagoides pteronyssinus TaxID=6956 RepID=A0ABQ8JKW8_DERPT|nr:hypothetical protein DERP_007632 [Dermatophagoides pteronyssinus]
MLKHSIRFLNYFFILKYIATIKVKCLMSDCSINNRRTNIQIETLTTTIVWRKKNLVDYYPCSNIHTTAQPSLSSSSSSFYLNSQTKI